MIKATRPIPIAEIEGPKGETLELEGFAVGGENDQVILESRGIILINTFIDKEVLARAFQRLLCLFFDPDYTDIIQVILNSPGGYTDAGWAFIDMMDFVKKKNPVHTVALGEIASMATMIFVNGSSRVMGPNTVAMIHQYSGGKYGNHSDLVASRKAENVAYDQMVRHLIKCSKFKTKAAVEKNLLKSTDNWLSPPEMKKFGLTDRVWSTVRKKKKAKKKK